MLIGMSSREARLVAGLTSTLALGHLDRIADEGTTSDAPHKRSRRGWGVGLLSSHPLLTVPSHAEPPFERGEAIRGRATT